MGHGGLTLDFEYASKLEPGKRADISINAGIYKGKYTSRIEDIDGKLVGVAHPLMKGALLPVYREMDFMLTVDDGGALYKFPMTVSKVDAKNGPPILWGLVLAEPERIQRRRFLRVSCFWNTRVFKFETEIAEPMSTDWLDVRIVDVSLGGYRFKCTGGGPFNPGDRILVNMTISRNNFFVLGRSSRIVQDKNTWDVGVEFDSLPLSVEKSLFEFIRQQEMLGKE